MGSKDSKQLKQQQLRLKTNKQLQDIYSMYQQTIQAVRYSKVLQSNLSNSSNNSIFNSNYQNRISNIDSVLLQLLQPFKMKSQYVWGKDVYKKFIKHFKQNFQEVWSINKEQFYKNLMAKCKFQTIDLQKELQQLRHNIQSFGEINAEGDGINHRQSYQQYFYEIGAAKIQQKLTSSLMKGQYMLNQQSNSNKKQQSKIEINLFAINSSIISQEQMNLYDLQDIKNKNQNKEAVANYDENEDFLPLFVNSSNKKLRMSTTSNPQVQQKRERLNTNILLEKIKLSRIQQASIISPQTVFFDKMTKQNKSQVSDLVLFYRQFANTLQQMFFSGAAIVSAPYKHFMYILTQKIHRKNIVNRHNQLNKSYLKKQLLFSQSKEGHQYREKRDNNINMLLEEIKAFAQAYTDFIWLFLQLDQICQSKIGRLINIYTLYGIAVKSVWKYVEWIAQRGFQYQQAKLQQCIRYSSLPRNANIAQDKKHYLMKVLMTLCGQKNPQKYLKKIVVFYRQVNKLSTCADDLLNIYEQLLTILIKNGLCSQIAIFRMPVIIDRLLKLQQSIANYGQISYCWTSWQIIIQIFKDKIRNVRLMNPPKVSTIHINKSHENINIQQDWQEIFIDD